MDSMIGAFILDTPFVFTYGFSTIVGVFFPLDSVNQHPTQKRPIVIVHGWLGKPPIYYFLKKYLESQGFAVYMTHFGLLTGDIHDSAKQLKHFIEEKQLRHVVLVGESLGGLVSYIFTQCYNGWDCVDELICITAPFGGSRFAHIPFWSTSARQIISDNSFIKDIQTQKPNLPERIFCIAARIDELISQNGSFLPGCHAIRVNSIGHVRTQAFSREVYQKITKIAQVSLI